MKSTLKVFGSLSRKLGEQKMLQKTTDLLTNKMNLVSSGKNQWRTRFRFLPRLFSTEKSAEEQQLNSTAEGQPPVANLKNEAVAADLSTKLMKLNKDLENVMKEKEELHQEKVNLLDKYRRSLADSENLRVRLRKQIDEAKVFGIQNFCKDLLEVADILGHATDAVPKEELNDKNPHLRNLYEGLSMTKASLLHVFKRHGLEALNPINEKFDPNLHEALFHKEEDGVTPNTIIEVTKFGYKLHNRVIRPALVGVAK